MTKKLIHAFVIYPSGFVTHRKIAPDENFELKDQTKYLAPEANQVARCRFLGKEWAIACYQHNTPKARPFWTEPSPGLTAADFQNIDGEWLVTMLRRAMKGDSKLGTKD